MTTTVDVDICIPKSVVNCDGVTSILTRSLGPQIGFLLESQEPALAAAIQAAFDLTLD